MIEETEPKKRKARAPHVLVIGGPWGRPHRIPNPATKRGWSVVKPKWRMHGYTKDTLPEIQWVGATKYVLVWVGATPFYVYDPQAGLVRRLLGSRFGSRRGLSSP